MAIAPTVQQRLDDAVRLVEADLRRFCRSLTRDEHEAADLAQEALMRSLPRLREGDLEPGAAGAYVRTVARNLLVSDRRRRRPSPAGTLDDLPIASPDLEPPQAVLLEEQRRRVRWARARLAPRQQAALQLRDVEGRPYGEIGDHLGLNENGVAQLLSRARRRLRSEVRLAHVDANRLPPACRARVPALVAEAEGELRGAEREALNAHLEQCRSCQAALAAARSAPERVRVLGPAGVLAALRRLAAGGLGGAGATAAAVVGGSALLAGGIAVAQHSAANASTPTASPAAIVRAASKHPGSTAHGVAPAAGHRGHGRAGAGPSAHPGHARAGTRGGGGAAAGAGAGAGASPSANAPAAAGHGNPPAASPGAQPGAPSPVPTPPLSRPSVSTPSVATPGVTTPGLTTPSITTPGVSTPVGTVPSATVPSATVPGVTVPGVTVPGVTTPTVTVPTVTVTVPTVTLPHLP
jgi:RNA polymerase sigma factor (sigma-70 family)